MNMRCWNILIIVYGYLLNFFDGRYIILSFLDRRHLCKTHSIHPSGSDARRRAPAQCYFQNGKYAGEDHVIFSGVSLFCGDAKRKIVSFEKKKSSRHNKKNIKPISTVSMDNYSRNF